ncbi:MAG: hypothetical protein Q8865_04110 [Bacillota bacterium]|nr:hypothetical protein [Bacillota bacterium]
MTKTELSQLYYLNREVEQQQNRLKELQTAANKCTTMITGMPRGNGKDRDLLLAEIADLQNIVELNLLKIQIERGRLERYINGINDSRLRLIMRLRYINGMKWYQIAMEIGGGNTEDSIKKAVYRFTKNI